MSTHDVDGYTHVAAFNDGFLQVSPLHKVFYQEFGNSDGKPVIFLHGGPGGSCSLQKSTPFFDPDAYRVVCLDQRGSGKSTPSGDLTEWTPDNVVADIEALRQHLHVPKWHIVFGGSWGSTLALLYAQAHPVSVGSLVLRGVYLETTEELRFSRGAQGAGRIRPEEFDKWIGHLSPEERTEPLKGYLKLLTCGNTDIETAAAKAYSRWGKAFAKFNLSDEELDKTDGDAWAHGRIECYHHVTFSRSSYDHFLGKENMAKIRHIPCSIVQGRYDICTTPRCAYELHKVWPGSRLFWVTEGGHSPFVSDPATLLDIMLTVRMKEPAMLKKLVEVCDEYRSLQIS